MSSQSAATRHSDEGEAAPLPAAREPAERTPWLIAPLVALAAFMEVLDISIANVSLQHIAGNLSATRDESTWILTAYLVTNAIILPISGWLSSVLGRKRFFMTCIAGFSISSLLCGFAPNLYALIAFRAVQGATGGGLQPSSQAILADSFPPAQRGMAFAFYGIAVVFAPAIGPTLGGWITDNFSWRWVFLINVPIGVILFLLTSALIFDPDHHREARQRKLANGLRVDYLGFGLLAVGLGLLQLVLDKGQQDDWFSSHLILISTIVLTVSLVGFVVWELSQDDPIVDLHLLKNPNFAVGNILMFVLGFILMGSTVLIPLYVQYLLGYTATDAGLVISPGGFAIMFMMPIVGSLVTKWDLRVLISIGLAIGGFSLLHMSGFDVQTDYASIALARVAQAMGLAFLFIPINAVAYVGVPPEKNNNASALINLSRNLGGSVGISLLTTMLARGAQAHQSVLADHISVYNPQYHQAVTGLTHKFLAYGGDASQALEKAQHVLYGQVLQQANMLAFVDDFRLLGYIFLALIPFVLLIKKGKPTGAAMAH